MTSRTQLRVVISGASGLIGSALTRSLEADGVEVTRLVRRSPRSSGEVQWNPGVRALSPETLQGATAVVNLNGASIGRLPWTKRYRATLRSSRIDATRTLATALRQLGSDAPHFVSASAVGIYGSQPGVTLTEQSPAGDSFLARLCAEWEATALSADTTVNTTVSPAANVALIRTSPLIHPDGVLKPLMTLTKLGVSGPLGPGTQVWPWISLADEVRAIRHIIDQRIGGPINLAGPTPATATETGRALARAMRRPFFVPAPAFALKLALGDAAKSLLLADACVSPSVLLDSGFEFRHTTVEAAIAAALDR